MRDNNNIINKTAKSLKRLTMVTLVLAAAVSVVACGKKTEAVIVDGGQDITQEVSQQATLPVSNNKAFSYDDLVLGKADFLMTEQEVSSLIGTPDTIKDIKDDGTSTGNVQEVSTERVYIYEERILTFTLIDGAYKLTAVESSASGDTFSRGIKVGSTFDDILNVYYRDVNCMNNIFYSADKTTALGKYLYGTFTIDDLENVKTASNVEYGVINFNGYASLEEAESYIVEMTYFEAPYKNGTASISDDFAQLAFDIDKSGKVTSIRWYYYPEE